MAHPIGLSIATVHGKIKDVYKTIVQLDKMASYFTTKQFVELYNKNSYIGP